MFLSCMSTSAMNVDSQAPADEPWTTGIFNCAQDTESCWTGLFCLCVLFGRNVEQLSEVTPWTGSCHCCRSWWMCGTYTGVVRQSLQKKYHLKNSPCDSCLVHWCALCQEHRETCDSCLVHWCALCQEHRETKGRLSDDVFMPMTVINPRHVQEMNADDASHIQDSASPCTNGGQLM